MKNLVLITLIAMILTGCGSNARTDKSELKNSETILQENILKENIIEETKINEITWDNNPNIKTYD